MRFEPQGAEVVSCGQAYVGIQGGGHPPRQIRQQRGPGIIGYRHGSDCRILVVSDNP